MPDPNPAAEVDDRPQMAAEPTLEITLFTDPACPFAFSAEPARLRLQWYYGDQLRWRTKMIVLTAEPGEADKLAEGAPTLQRRYGMPLDPAPYARPASSEPACRAVVAARLHAPTLEEPFLRRLRVRTMLGGLLDDPELIGAAARDVGLEPSELERWCASENVGSALRADVDAARCPSAAARALDHKLGGPPEQRRYTAPSYVITRRDDRGGLAAPANTPSGTTLPATTVPGFNPIEAYEAAIANLAPELVRRPKPENVIEVLAWAAYPLATAEVGAIAQVDAERARDELGRVARPIAAGPDFYWSLPGAQWAASRCGADRL